jgi:DNA-binding NtrC family response regulator
VRRFVREFSAQHDRPFHGISAEALALLVSYPWPGNVRELRNLVESMVVLAPGREIGADDIPRAIRDAGGRRLLPVPVGPVVREGERAQGRELEFIVRSLVELKLQVEELRRRMDVEVRPASPGWVGDGAAVGPLAGSVGDVWIGPASGGIPPRDQPAPPGVITVGPETTMAEIERQAIELVLRETGGNRRKTAERLAIGERTLYRKLREYEADGSWPDLDIT